MSEPDEIVKRYALAFGHEADCGFRHCPRCAMLKLLNQLAIAKDIRALSDSEDRILHNFDEAVAEAHAMYLAETADLRDQLQDARATIAQLQQHISRIETETKGWIADLIAEGGARKVGPLEHILAVIQSSDPVVTAGREPSGAK